MKTIKWDIYGELKTEEDIQAFVEASITEAENDTDPSLLAHALGVAAKARGMLAVSRDTGVDRAGIYRSFAKGGDPRISTFDKVARSLGYHLTLAPVQK
ncbi:MAG: putative addiction module antidote protein [Treponema sp.]|jgi:probable addiction module antidote protein|nr:putative addiction module antidote protein [Treponema sp.]